MAVVFGCLNILLFAIMATRERSFGIFLKYFWLIFWGLCPEILPPIILTVAILKIGKTLKTEQNPSVSSNSNDVVPSQPLKSVSPPSSLDNQSYVPISPDFPVDCYDKTETPLPASEGHIFLRKEPALTITPPEDDQNTLLKLKPILPYLDQYLKNQKNPLENLEKFYEYLKLKKFDLTPGLKEQIKKKIEEAIEEQKNKQREEELGMELFGAPDSPTPVQPGSTSVLPQSSITPGSACQVCLSEFSSAEPGAVKCPHCGNLFHYRCITKWVNKNGTCPICKKELKV